MKKFLTLGVLSIFLLSGCNVLSEIQKVGDDVSDSYEKASKEAKETIEEVKETKAKIDETVNDLKDAKEKIKEATSAVSEIVK